MPEEKLCPFRFIAPYTMALKCFRIECELWSEEISMCSISLGMNAILSVADALRGISEHIKSLDSFQS